MAQSRDEIDLKELVSALWAGKLSIVIFTLLGAACAISYALLAQQWWSSHALISSPLPQDIAAYREQVKQFQPVFDVYQDDGTVLVSTELDALVNPNVLFQRFISAFNSNNNKSDFLDTSVQFQTFKVALEQQGLDEDSLKDSLRSLYAEWFQRISATLSEPNIPSSPYRLSLQSTTKTSSYELLIDYLDLIQAHQNADALNNLESLVQAKKKELIQQKNILETQAKGELEVEAERAKYALEIAKAAQVHRPILSGNNKDELFDIDLGTKALDEKVKVLKSVKNLSVVEPRLEQINAKLKMLDALKVDRNVRFQTYKLLEDVEQPISRDKPKRALVAVLGTFFGAMFGVGIVLIRFAFRKES
ncbi:Wzz/FepE/Etk N-terminal domain-containing protein [Vibrio xiamenensis]